MKVESTVALVTGGASGLGRATVERLVERGAKVVIVDRDEAQGARLAERLGESVRFAKTDVTDEAAVQAAVDMAAELGELRIAVSCAGVGWAQRVLSRSGTPHPLEMFQTVININLVGTFNVLRLTAAEMVKQEPTDTGERGVIVNTASIAAFDGQIGQVAYAASKGAIVGMTLPAARDLAKVGIRVACIAPGIFDTPLLATLPETVRQTLAEGVPFPQRLGDVRDFARFVESIVTNPYLNGETVRLDGALRMGPK